MMNQINIIVLEDHPIIRTSICGYLNSQFKQIFIVELDEVSSVFNVLKSKEFTHLILDLKLKDGNTIEVLPTIRALHPQIKILIISGLPREIYYPALAQYGLFDYIEKSMDLENMKLILADFITNPLKQKKQPVFKDNPFLKLTIREFEVLNYLVNGNSIKDIAELLNVHTNTISTYKLRILEKTNTTTMKDLIDLCTLWKIE